MEQQMEHRACARTDDGLLSDLSDDYEQQPVPDSCAEADTSSLCSSLPEDGDGCAGDESDGAYDRVGPSSQAKAGNTGDGGRTHGDSLPWWHASGWEPLV
jgi:hypothetical protein